MAGKKRAPGGRGDYEVGYCRPPVNTRWQKGRSPNPGGRPKASASGMKAIPGPRLDNPIEDAVLRVMNEVVECEVSPGHWRRVPQSEALVRELVARAAYDQRSLKQLLEMYDLAQARQSQLGQEQARVDMAPLVLEIAELLRAGRDVAADAESGGRLAVGVGADICGPSEAGSGAEDEATATCAAGPSDAERHGSPVVVTLAEPAVCPSRDAATRAAAPGDAAAVIAAASPPQSAVRRDTRAPLVPCPQLTAGHGFGLAGSGAAPPPRFS